MRIALIAACVLICSMGYCEEEKALDPQQAFYRANAYYAERDYQKASDAFNTISDAGLENGALYYNIGNCYFKMGKLGYAILFYEKAARLMPQDGDLKSNLSYARQQLGYPDTGFGSINMVSRIIKIPYRGLNLNAVSILTLAMYLIIIAMAAFLISKPFLWKRLGLVFIITCAVFLSNLSAFGLRYYDEEILRQGIVVQKEAECKYEPIDKSTIYYKLQEGNDVFVLATRDGWRQVRRLDGKIAWVKREAVEEI